MNQSSKTKKSFFHHIFLLPFVLAMLLILLMFDFCLSIYHRISFAICGIERVKRGPNFKVDYEKFAYLNRLDRFYGILTHYATSLFNYAKKISQATENYWCRPQKIKGGRYIMDKNQKRMNALRQKAEYKNALKKKKKKK